MQLFSQMLQSGKSATDNHVLRVNVTAIILRSEEAYYPMAASVSSEVTFLGWDNKCGAERTLDDQKGVWLPVAHIRDSLSLSVLEVLQAMLPIYLVGRRVLCDITSLVLERLSQTLIKRSDLTVNLPDCETHEQCLLPRLPGSCTRLKHLGQ